MNRYKIVTFCFISLLLFVVYQVFRIFSPFAHSIFWAAILTFGFYPIYIRFKVLFGRRDTLAALSMTLLIILIVTPPLVFIIANIATQAVELYQFATDYIRAGHLENTIDSIKDTALVEKLRANTFVEWDRIKENSTNWILSLSRGITNYSLSQVGILTKNVFIIGVNLIFIAFLTFVFLKDGQKIYEFLFQITPLEDDNKAAVFDQINGTFSAVIRGQILTSLTQAAIAGTLFAVLGLPLPIFFALATFVTALIPLIGAAGIWFPMSVYLYLNQMHTKAIILFVCGALIISMIDNVMKPAVIGEKTKLPYFLLFFGILGGLKVYGILGVFLAPAVLSLFFSLIKIYQEKFFLQAE